MQGVSRSSFAALRERLAEEVPGPVVAEMLGDELFAVLRVLDREHALRRALSDPAKHARQKEEVASALFGGRVAPATEELITAAVSSRWASPSDLADAVEHLAVEALVMVAEAEGRLDDLEDELFRFGRVVAAQPELRAALSGPALPAERKRGLLDALLAGKVTPVALRLITEMAVHPRGRALQHSLDLAARIAAQRRERLIAVVRVAAPLPARQRDRLTAALSQHYHRDVHLNVVLDPAILGGMTVQVGDELIDGSVASRLAAVRRRLAG